MKEFVMAVLVDKLVDVQLEHEVSNEEMSKYLFRLALSFVNEDKLEKELHL